MPPSGFEREFPVANYGSLQLVCFMNNAGEFLEVFRLAGQLQNVDSAHRVPLLQAPTDPAIAREGVVAEVFPDEKPSTVVFAFGDLEFHSGVVGAVSVKTP